METASEKSSETQMPSMEALRHAFARCCKVLGLSQDTCVALTLLLNSEEELKTMLWAMLQAEDAGIKWGTTEVVRVAEKIKEASEKKDIE